MKNILIGVLVLVAVGLSFVGGYYTRGYRTQETKAQVLEVKPSPTPDTDKFANDKATVKSFDGKKLVYTLEDKTEKTVNDVTAIKVWLKQVTKDAKAVEADWKAVKVGTSIVVASEKATGRITGVLVL